MQGVKMNTKAMKPLPQANTQVDLSNAETMKCEQCESTLFTTSYIIKRISAIVSPTGQEAIVPIQVYSCEGCSKVPSIFIKAAGLEENLEEDSSIKQTLI